MKPNDNINQVMIKIGGMHCAMCVKTVADALSKVPGVRAVNVNLANEKAYLEFDNGHFSIEAAKRAIESVGYQYLGREGEQDLIEQDKTLNLNLAL